MAGPRQLDAIDLGHLGRQVVADGLEPPQISSTGDHGGRAGDASEVDLGILLVHVVADANRCRSVFTEALGCCTLVGAAGDLDAVEVLVPSLLLQAHIAMARCGRRTDRSGTSRTRSFRQSFLLAYAQRIGERLRSADERVAVSSSGSGELVPVLAHHRERVDAACAALFPEVVPRAGTVNNSQGW